MFFGIREKRIQMGSFNSDKCEKCGKGEEYQFFKITKYFVAFFINLIPLGSSYEYVCEQCEVTETVDRDAGKILANKKFGKKQRIQILQTVLKISAFLLVIAAAVVLPLLLRQPDFTNPAVLKALVKDDGVYSIQNDKGDIYAIVEILEGEKTITFFDDTSTLTGEGGADKGFVIHHHYEQVSDDKQVYPGALLEIGEDRFERILDDVGVLKDQYDVPVRSYYFDIENDSLGFAMGIADLTTIEYTKDKATYYLDYYLSDQDVQSYAVVLYLGDTQKISATFIPKLSGDDYDQLASLNVYKLENGRVLSQTIYELDEETQTLAYDSGILISSSLDEINAFIKDNELKPVYIVEYKYYKDTEVVTSMDISMPDELGVMQTTPQNFDVTMKNGYYIQQEHQEAE